MKRKGKAPDRNYNGRIDSCDIAGGTSLGVDQDGVPDEAQPDCNGNGIPDSHEIETGQAEDCDGDGRLDTCDLVPGALEYSSPRHMETGRSPDLIRFADLDRDGVEDLFLLRGKGEESILDIYRNGGLAGFGLLHTFALGEVYWSAEVLDLDRDGILDLAGIRAGRGDQRDYLLAVFIGNGDGAFQPPQPYPVGRRPRTLIAVDTDGDGLVDLLTGNYDSSDVTLLRGRGDGTFEDGMEFQAGPRISGMATGDVDRDGAVDLVLTSSEPGFVSILPGRRGFDFEPPLHYFAGFGPRSTAILNPGLNKTPTVITVNNLSQDLSFNWKLDSSATLKSTSWNRVSTAR